METHYFSLTGFYPHFITFLPVGSPKGMLLRQTENMMMNRQIGVGSKGDLTLNHYSCEPLPHSKCPQPHRCHINIILWDLIWLYESPLPPPPPPNWRMVWQFSSGYQRRAWTNHHRQQQASAKQWLTSLDISPVTHPKLRAVAFISLQTFYSYSPLSVTHGPGLSLEPNLGFSFCLTTSTTTKQLFFIFNSVCCCRQFYHGCWEVGIPEWFALGVSVGCETFCSAGRAAGGAQEEGREGEGTWSWFVLMWSDKWS